MKSLLSWRVTEICFLGGVFFLPFSKTAAEIGFITALSVWILSKISRKEKFPQIKLCNLFYGIFLIFTFLSLLSSHFALSSVMHGFLKWVKYLGIFFLSFEFFENRECSKKFLWVFSASLFLVCLDGLYQAWFGADLIRHYPIDIPGRFLRIRASFGSPNDLAGFLILGIPLMGYLWFKEKKWHLKSAGLCFLLVLFGAVLVLTLSRAAVLALFLAIAFFIVLFQPRKMIPLILVLIIFCTVLFSSGILKVNFLGSLNAKDITIVERFRFWGITWRMILAKPWFGHGVNSYYQNFQRFAPASETYRGYAHNCYLQMWSEVGFFGLLAFLVPFLNLLPRRINEPASRNECSLNQSLWVGLVAFLIQSFFDTNFYALQCAFIFWIFWGFYLSQTVGDTK